MSSPPETRQAKERLKCEPPMASKATSTPALSRTAFSQSTYGRHEVTRAVVDRGGAELLNHRHVGSRAGADRFEAEMPSEVEKCSANRPGGTNHAALALDHCPHLPM